MRQPLKAGIDFLTRCYTRDGLAPFLKELEQETLLHKKPFSLLVMDVDNFKSFNDKFGHLTGDEVLKYFSSSMRLDLEDEENLVFRFGGDEFVVVFPLKNAGEAYRLATRLRRNMRKRACIVKGRQLNITFSGGIACFPDDAHTMEELFERADKALYYSKNHGRAKVTCFGHIPYIKYVKILIATAVLFAVYFVTAYFRPGLMHYLGLLKNYEIKVGFGKKNEPILPDAAQSFSSPANVPKPVLSVVPARPAPTEEPAPMPVETPPAGKLVTVYLTTGRAVRGELLEEGEEDVKLQISLQEGKGEIRLKRSQIVTIEDAAA